MVWQRSGTVAVQNGSTTVVGTNVDFAASSRNGDSFIGPDGATYEVSNVASATVISILPAYKGPTVSGAGYAIMPVQGYDKMLSDAFNTLVNQFGTKLAALGTTGNYDTLPVNKGGTGGTNQATAQGALGLVPVATTIDTTPGRLLVTGSFGVGGPAINQAPGTNANTTNLPSGRYYADAWVGTPSASGYLDIQRNLTTGFAMQIWESLESGQFATRSQYSGVWQDWLVSYNQKNAITDPASGGLMSYSAIGGWTAHKFLNGIIRLSSPQFLIEGVPANTVQSLNRNLPVVFVSDTSLELNIAPDVSHDYTKSTCYVDSGSVASAYIKNGATVQNFVYWLSAWGRWK